MSSKDLITNIDRLIREYTYAGIEDLKSSSSTNRFDNTFYEHYANLIADKAAKKVKLTPIFNVNTDFKVAFGMLFDKFIENLQNININTGDSIGDIINEFDTLDECYGKFIFEVGCKKLAYGKCLEHAFDQKKYFDAKIEVTLERHRNNKAILAMVSQTFDTFLKNVAYWMAETSWHESKVGKNGFSAGYLVWIMSIMGLERSLTTTLFDNINAVLDEINKVNREKMAKRPKKASKKDANTPATTEAVKTEPSDEPKIAGVSSAANSDNMAIPINEYIGNMLVGN